MSVLKVVYQGPGFLSLLTITFIVLKLCNVIAWSWFWVLSPILIPLMILSGVGIIAGLIFLVALALNK